MTDLETRLQRLRALNAAIGSQDRELAEERADLAPKALASPKLAVQRDLNAGPEPTEHRALLAEISKESIILRRERPILAIRENKAELVFKDQADSEIWKQRLTDAAPALDIAIRAAGRIELSGAEFDWVGTGWLVRNDIIVTNRHVAEEFSEHNGSGFVFKQGTDGAMKAGVDFLEEIDNPDELVFRLLKPLYIEEEPGPDVAFFQVELLSGDAKLADPIPLAAKPGTSHGVAVIGYPAFDSRIPDVDLMEDLYGRVYNKKRLAPGAITAVKDGKLLHNCTTLGGNSGSCVLDLSSGEAFGLHFSGRFMATNYAVPADTIRSLLAKVLKPHAANRTTRRDTRVEVSHGPQDTSSTVQDHTIALATASVTIPVTVSISVGQPVAHQPSQPIPRRGPDITQTADLDGEEAAVADYRDRKGYRATFLHADDSDDMDDDDEANEASVALPEVTGEAAKDVLSFQYEGKAETALRYQHFSVVMSESRRMCFFSAVNIDGSLAKKTKRPSWRWDPRIPRAQQIMNECYGDPPRFSRGHMTRREDPAWGEPDIATRGNADSMHVTNATPQMQSFNSPVWLELEDYALGHARQDRMRISVFTGPYFTDKDPELYGVRIPLRFWKIIAFIHDDTGKLCATGYEMGQEADLLPEEEFVFGRFASSHVDGVIQTRISTIQARTLIDFGQLVAVDPLAGDNEARFDRSPRRIADLTDIRFVR
ncbi:endonuclease G [Rhizobium leguminosarum]|uniref:Endonuclease G n=1 Tax=Rhizobium leguminosarum TaxID=384 RepID=A0AAE2T0L8_RHILE|nr:MULTISPECIES: DNA/RNA non-specific endonuclease [Rhizobium]MBB4293743.1 endonuclease G [Rhizobium leguminosarum]MBB4299343.1 endonuclease G [Rhizobium leguminosarum]MBB4310842.1 endonuclease G [Rhizobium leguminosarum]MBB4420046.1 endonuclease G [Rhizobium leguminosarum]MBB4435223.1 endonuclease G [Rhizobium esperanzae]